MPTDAHQRAVEQATHECLMLVAAASYREAESVVCYPAVKVALASARKELLKATHTDVRLLTDVLEGLVPLVQGEVLMEMAGKRVLMTFPAYEMSFEASLPAILHAVAQEVEVDADRPWVDPFHAFSGISKEIYRHYRALSEKVVFHETLLLKWILSSITYATRVHLDLLQNPPRGSENFCESVRERVGWYVQLPPWFFAADRTHSEMHVREASEDLAYLALWMLQHGELALASECTKAIASIADAYAKGKDPKPFSWADAVVCIEYVAIGADALGRSQFAAGCRAQVVEPPAKSERDVAAYGEARKNRLGHLRHRLGQRERYGSLSAPHDPLSLLRRVVAKAGVSGSN